MKKIRKAVIPVAGLGTRFLPATKSMPKEMLPVVDRPVVQYAVDEAFEAGIEHIVFVTGRNKAVIEDYFDLHPELIGTLEQTGKKTQLEALESMLPVAGVDGTLERRMRDGPATDRVQAKTGSMAHVHSLAGYVTTANGQQLAFAILLNNDERGAVEPPASGDIDAIVQLLAGWRGTD